MTPEKIHADLNDIERQSGQWSLGRIADHFSRENRDAPIHFGGGGTDGINMPTKTNDAKNFAFTQKTRAQAQVKGPRGQDVLFEFENEGKKNHAEDALIARLDEGVRNDELNNKEKISITINNSPCLRCARRLREFKKRWPGEIELHFANPYGSDEEQNQARAILRDAGIAVRSFAPEKHLKDRPTSRQSERFNKVKTRRKSNRASWAKEHASDASSDSDSDAEPAMKRSRPNRAAGPKRRG